MSDKGLEYQKIMNGLGKIPGLNLPIPGLGPSGYKEWWEVSCLEEKCFEDA